jgi:predicted NBD/HSP70 family sugar kinase
MQRRHQGQRQAAHDIVDGHHQAAVEAVQEPAGDEAADDDRSGEAEHEDADILIAHARSDAPGTSRGRPKVDLSVNPDAGLVGAIILQLNAVSAALVDYSGALLADCEQHLDTQTASAASLRKAIIGCMRTVLTRSGKPLSSLRGIAVGVEGVTDIARTQLCWSPITGERNVPISRWLQEAFHAPVSVCNDCDFMALALNWREPKRYGGNFAAILVAHGVGMGLFLRGGLINGTRTSGTEFGHMIHIPGGALCRCGSRGCIEAYAADYAIKRRADGLPAMSPPPASVEPEELAVIAEAARRGERNAVAAIEEAGWAIGTGLAGIYALVDPFPVVLIGSGTLAQDLLDPIIRSAVQQSIAVRNAVAVSGEDGEDLRIEYESDYSPLVREGCVVRALLALDDEIADAES